VTTAPGDLVVIGCGNLLRGDDAVGPVLVRHLWERGVPDRGVLLVDGGTAGMDVSFKMRGAGKVVIVDASSTGSPPGTVFQVPAAELEDLPPLDGFHSHSFRWDHALAFGRWLLGDDYPDDITVFLIEAGTVELGAELTPAVQEAMVAVAERVLSMIHETTIQQTTEGQHAACR
jgi:hydrogenase maturation protease